MSTPPPPTPPPHPTPPTPTGQAQHPQTLSAARLRVQGLALGPFQTNGYIVSVQGARECWVIDAPYGAERLVAVLQQQGLTPSALILTHAHADHIAGAFAVVNAFRKDGVPVWMHQAEERWMSDPVLNLSDSMGMPVTAPDAQRFLNHGEVLELGGVHFEVRHTPGHSPGSISLYAASAGVVFAGDALFAGSIGRTDFPGSSHEQLLESIRRHLYTLPDQTTVWPGHGPSTTIGREKRSNPYVRG